MKRAINVAVSLGMTVLCSWLVFRKTNLDEQWQSLASANYLWVLPYLGVLAMIHFSRTLRWRALLSGLERVGFRAINEASGIGFMMLIIIPFRLGELARPFLIARRSGIRRSAAMTTVVLERITDGICVAVAMWVLLFFVPEGAPNLGMVRAGAHLMFGIFATCLVFLIFALRHQVRAVRLVQVTLGRLSPRLAGVAAHIVDTFVGAMRRLPDRRQILIFFGYTLVYWLANGAGMSLLGLAFAGVGPGDGFHLSLFEGYLVMCVLVVGVMIPAAPGMAGTFHYAVVLGVSLFLPENVTSSVGLAFATVLWICQTGQQVGLGLYLMSRGRISFSEIARNLSADPGKEPEGASAPGPQASTAASR